MTPSVRKSSFFFPSKDTYFLRKSVFFITEVTEEKKAVGKRSTNLWVLDALGVYYVYVYL